MNKPTFPISTVAEMTGLSIDTLRYYEKIGLAAPPERGVGDRRLYTEEDIGKLRFLTYLKRTNMPLRRIRAYVERYAEQDEEQCYALLAEHKQSIERQIAEMKETLTLIEYKLQHFQDIKDGKAKEREL